MFSTIAIGSLNLKNRIVMPPMCMYRANKEGLANDWHYVHYCSRAVGQVGLIVMEATGVMDGGRISENDLGLWNDQQIDGLKRIVDAVHEHNGKVALQLNHAGRKSTVPYIEPVAPSAIPFSEKYRTPKALTHDEIQQIVESFGQAALRAVKAGFDAIEVHAAHGYLINQFLSPVTNRRNDEYGGSAENRVRLLGEVLQVVREALPKSMPLIVRVSAHEYEPAGNTPETVGGMINMVKNIGIDIIDVSTGAVTPVVPKAFPGYQIGYANLIKEITGLPVIGGGLVTRPPEAEMIIKAGVDLVYIGRELLRSPYWVLEAAGELHEEVVWPEPYLRAKK